MKSKGVFQQLACINVSKIRSGRILSQLSALLKALPKPLVPERRVGKNRVVAGTVRVVNLLSIEVTGLFPSHDSTTSRSEGAAESSRELLLEPKLATAAFDSTSSEERS